MREEEGEIREEKGAALIGCATFLFTAALRGANMFVFHFGCGLVLLFCFCSTFVFFSFGEGRVRSFFAFSYFSFFVPFFFLFSTFFLSPSDVFCVEKLATCDDFCSAVTVNRNDTLQNILAA